MISSLNYVGLKKFSSKTHEVSNLKHFLFFTFLTSNSVESKMQSVTNVTIIGQSAIVILLAIEESFDVKGN